MKITQGRKILVLNEQNWDRISQVKGSRIYPVSWVCLTAEYRKEAAGLRKIFILTDLDKVSLDIYFASSDTKIIFYEDRYYVI